MSGQCHSLLNYTLTGKGKVSLHYLNYIQRKYIKITSKSQKQIHFAVFRPSRREADTTNSLLWFLGARRAGRDRDTKHFNPHSRPAVPSRSHRAKPWRPKHNRALELPGSSRHGAAQRSYRNQAVTNSPAQAAPARLMPRQHGCAFLSLHYRAPLAAIPLCPSSTLLKVLKSNCSHIVDLKRM